MRSEYRWVATVFLVPACFTVLMLFVPIPTSLGDGTDENVLTGWQGFYDRFSHRSFCRFWFKGGNYHDVGATPFFRRWLSVHDSSEFLATPLDVPGVILHAYGRHPRAVEQNLGTYNNVQILGRPFPASPVAYSAGLMRSLSRRKWNPKNAGGPNIPPGWWYSHRLQIDTRRNNNSLIQLLPQEMPRPLKQEWSR